MAKQERPKFAIPIERTVPDRKPGGWMPFVWIIFAALLAAGIIFGMRIFFPVSPPPEEIVQSYEELVTEPEAPVSDIADAEVVVITAADGAERIPDAPAAAETPVESAPAAPQPMPSETEILAVSDPRSATLARAVALEKRTDGRTTAVIHMKAGESVEVISHEGGGMVRVRYKEAEGVVSENALISEGGN